MQFTDIVVLLFGVALGWFILHTYGVLGGNRAAKKAVADNKSMKSNLRKRKIVSRGLGFFEWFANQLGGGITVDKKTKYDFYITRLELQVPVLKRNWKPIEMAGLHRLIQFLGIMLMLLGMSSLKFNFLWLFGVLALFPKIRETGWELRLSDEDLELEVDFPDLFMMLNPKLKQGTNARIAPVLTEYMQTMDLMHSEAEHKAIKKFVRLLRNQIEIFPDETLALTKIRAYYKTACIVNFCNIAVQSMSGVANKEKLIAFEQELTNRRMNEMRKRAAKLIEKAQKSVYLMYAILAEFIILTLWSRIGGNLDLFFNLM